MSPEETTDSNRGAILDRFGLKGIIVEVEMIHGRLSNGDLQDWLDHAEFLPGARDHRAFVAHALRRGYLVSAEMRSTRIHALRKLDDIARARESNPTASTPTNISQSFLERLVTPPAAEFRISETPNCDDLERRNPATFRMRLQAVLEALPETACAPPKSIDVAMYRALSRNRLELSLASEAVTVDGPAVKEVCSG